ncbi:unnamed protein product [Moneuplotes crassus]|uniref:Uncharacterized protein n=1 Tax=Euplotes crassus TaxID=5936 RepID=A0AAD1XIU5_EUPCR|nr:unnamed protein product [Moneuplotes crassus]
MATSLFSSCSGRERESCIMRKALSIISILIFIFCLICLVILYKHMDRFFQVRCKLLIMFISTVSMFFIILHYAAGLTREYAIVFVIIQEFFKSSSMLYVIYFYIKNATEFVDEERSKRIINYLKIIFTSFVSFFGLSMLIWCFLWIGNFIITEPCRDIAWIIYRIITLVLIIVTLFVGIKIQKRVKAKTVVLYGHDKRRAKSKEQKRTLHNNITNGSIVEDTDTQSDLSIGIWSNSHQHDSINKTLRNMWICFVFIIFICLFDVTYNLYWRFIPNFKYCDRFTNSKMTNALIFLLIRLISLYLIFIPIIFTFLGWNFVSWIICWPCKRNTKRRVHPDDSEYYSDL